MSAPYLAKISRRATLQWLAAATASLGLSHYTGAAMANAVTQSFPTGYGTDPDLNNPIVPWARTMTKTQLQITAALADIILPATESAPAPSVLGIQEFVDEWVSAPYPEQQADRTVVLDGLRWLDDEAKRRWQRRFLQIKNSRQRQLLDATVVPYRSTSSRERAPAPLATSSATGAPVPDSFFSRFRFILVGAYYTTPEGFKDIGYIGNVPLPSYPPISEHEKAVLDRELLKLGIK